MFTIRLLDEQTSAGKRENIGNYSFPYRPNQRGGRAARCAAVLETLHKLPRAAVIYICGDDGSAMMVLALFSGAWCCEALSCPRMEYVDASFVVLHSVERENELHGNRFK